ncbi:ABC transporter ATP-binding protein [Saccharopolyspora dendranthemae]|uniref:Fatty acid ABC transporter ATP-binding/permease protein n=1 Tax=Saccharopolyspora dendranthemae TaxID=1181886 RepID=A0A561U3F0_9PSEU|nr:ABC transporter ATP-binding protein [Saccharopolyspora dendranthemae]TWF93889.1 ATP-binding cassette subfamily B protein [Saccharopolyspora dendranthemae]
MASTAEASSSTILRLLAMLRPYRVRLVLVLVLGTGATVFNLAGPKLVGNATDMAFAGVVSRGLPPGASKEEVIAGMRARGDEALANVLSTADIVPGQGVNFQALAQLLVIILVLYLASGLCMLVQGRVVAFIAQHTMFVLRERVSAKLTRLPLGYFDRTSRGEVLSRVTNDVDNLQRTLQQTLGHMVNSIFAVVGVMTVMVLLSPLLAGLVLVSVLVAAAAALTISRRARPRFAERWQRTGSLNGYVEETYTGHSTVVAFGRGELAERTFDEHNEALYLASSRSQTLSGLIGPVTRFVTDLNYVMVAVVGALLVASGSMSIGSVQSFMQYSSMFTQPIIDMANFSAQLQSGMASARRVFEVLDEPEQRPAPPRPVRPRRVRGRVDFQQVSFRYTPDAPLIENLSLSAVPGELIAIVGPTGAGKSTLGNLLLRFYEVDRGRILLDGVDVADMTREDLRSRIGLVSQDSWLFAGTIADNIAYGRPGATRQEVVNAARAMCVDRFVRSLPDGYDTVLDDESSTVSAGERQLITLARAFLAEPSILLLDEATSSVDSRTEVLIQQAMASLRAGRTSFVIAHRLSTIRHADMILVMDSGRVVERGTHQQLLAANGHYSRMYAS